ncbi:TonB-dependent receptor [Odoribacter sp. OttesenSCG-928-J03]|nr:TonB-dependent receptor [Odoribacter sp. OttesenSCG-928-J03]MDL2283186.1 TonB-dependent receptor [Odoribacter sp. OttesenSCG-928-G04]MDL2331304.1 TonB-dependent receptor [Odoribacter sp. OttesenSCG-928-A06]
MRYLLLIILIIGGLNTQAQEIHGRVIDKGPDGQVSGLPGANVYWQGTTDGVGTDMEGNFSIQWNKVGKLIVSFIGYNTETIEVSPTSDNLLIALNYGTTLEEVNVMGRKSSTVLTTRGPIIEQVITGEELCKAACCNLGESFTTNASVDVSYADAVTGAKQIQLLGLTGKYVQMMTENMPNFRGVSSLYGMNYIPGPWMSSISVSKGVGSVINGYEAIAGQVSTDYKKPRVSEKIFANAYVNDEEMYEFNVNGSVLLNDKWSTAILLHHDRMQKEHTSHGYDFLDMPKQSQYNIMNRWEYKSDAWNIQFGGKFLDEDKLSGEKGFKKSMKDNYGPGNLYGIGVETRRYEGFVKTGYLMPEYENTSMALLINYTDHDQQSYFGARNYNVTQRTLYANYIFQSIFGNNENQKYSTGVSFNYDNYDESFNDYLSATATKTPTVDFNRTERVAGAFFQYTGLFWNQLTVMAGVRYDYNSLYHGLFTPRMHIAYSPDDMTIFKVSAGSGARSANILSDNSYLLASGHAVYVNNQLLVNNPSEIDRLDMEKAWNFGVLISRKFYLFNRLLTINLDYYRTDFSRQVVVDNETDPDKINFYNLDGDSYSNCYQAELKYELIPRLDFLAAFRYNDVKQTVGGKLLRQSLQSKYKGLLNLSYATNMKKWQFDFTTQFNGPGRLPGNEGDFKSYEIMNAQVSKFFRKWSIYAGCENIGNFTQDHPIRGYDDPWGTAFDASKIWGPVHGRKFYLGVRFGLER